MGRSGFNIIIPSYQPGNQADIAGSFAHGVQNAATRQNTLQKKEADRQAQEFRMLLGAASQGNEQALGALKAKYPNELIKFQEQQIGLEKQQLAQREELRKENQGALNSALVQLDAVAKNPSAWSIARRNIGPILGLELPEAAPDAESINAIRQELEAKYQVLNRPEALTEYGKAAQEQNLIPGTDKFLAGTNAARAEARLARERAAAAGSPKVNVNTGAAPATTANVTESQKKLLGIEESKGRVAAIQKFEPEKFLTLQGRGLTLFSSMKDYLGKADKGQRQRVSDFARFKGNVEREFQSRVYAISGAATAAKQLEDLKNAFFNLDMSPTEFRASVEDYISELKRSERLLKRFIAAGIDTRTPEGGQLFDESFSGNLDQGNTRQDMLIRLNQLKEQKITDPAKQREILISEGYIQ